ncbi:MAG: hypothetical protein M5R38_09655 [Candidatus Methylomirabilis sp.]|nr:hypothetical protein [Candidatus Methylomirabilis sp.]
MILFGLSELQYLTGTADRLINQKQEGHKEQACGDGQRTEKRFRDMKSSDMGTGVGKDKDGITLLCHRAESFPVLFQ